MTHPLKIVLLSRGLSAIAELLVLCHCLPVFSPWSSTFLSIRAVPYRSVIADSLICLPVGETFDMINHFDAVQEHEFLKVTLSTKRCLSLVPDTVHCCCCRRGWLSSFLCCCSYYHHCYHQYQQQQQRWRDVTVSSLAYSSNDVIVTSSTTPETPRDVTDDAPEVGVGNEVQEKVEGEIQLFWAH